MKYKIVAVGKLKEAYLREACAEYVKRLSESEQVTMTAYEVSVSKLAAFDDDENFDLDGEFDLYAAPVHDAP